MAQKIRSALSIIVVPNDLELLVLKAIERVTEDEKTAGRKEKGE